MSRHKAIKTQHEDMYGVLEFFGKENSIMACTSARPQLFGIESDEKSLSEYFSKYRKYAAERNFDWEKDFPKEWELVEVEINIVEKPSISNFFLNYVKNLEVWEEVSPSEAEKITSIIRFEGIEPFDESSSLHVYETRYRVDGEVIRLIGAIGEDSGYSVERLKKEKE